MTNAQFKMKMLNYNDGQTMMPMVMTIMTMVTRTTMVMTIMTMVIPTCWAGKVAQPQQPPFY